jgi:hypothetical protein
MSASNIVEVNADPALDLLVIEVGMGGWFTKKGVMGPN